MVAAVVIFYFSSILLFSFVECQGSSTLRLVHLMHRHGDRTPTKTFPHDIYQEDFWPNGFGQLTKLGIKQLQDLGRYFRDRYSSFLNATYKRAEIYVRSTDRDRTLQSAYSALAGLYPDSSQSQEDCPNIPWQPVPVHTTDYNTDNLLRMGTVCPHYSEEFDIAYRTIDAQELHVVNEDMLQLVADNTGLNTTDLSTVWDYVCDSIFIEGIYNLTLPAWVTPEIYKQLHEFKNHQYDFWFYTQEMIRIRAGPFLKEMSDHIRAKMDGTMDPQMKMFMYSAHDSTVGAQLFAMDQWNGILPPYMATLFWELHEISEGEFAVKILYKNDSLVNPAGEPLTLKLTECDVMCPVDDFLRLMKPVTFEGDWFAFCNHLESHDAHGHYSGTTVAVAVCVALVVLMLIGLVTWYYCRSQSKYKYQSTNDPPPQLA